ncbi:UPF0182 family protein [Ilumatobacter nonamiensis]|uniref:UPF0182 family protein n=1 Tax=Ilumatobacter nonamiensis TaxID=467093 RepID=UPI00034A2270|nr:UPF0182 family protein [Ilumatobacter nonamiensis]
MRRSQDLGADRRRLRFSGRGVLIALGALLLFVLIFGRAIARFYIDFLWHDALGRNDVFWGAIGAKATLFVGFFLIFVLISGINLYVADRTAPETFPANVHPYVERFHEIFGQRLRLVRYGVALVFALMLAAPAISRWQEWLLFRNSQSFGTSDAQFGRDVGFYVFELPFLSFLLDWMFVAVIVTLLLTVAAHVLNGGVVLVSPVPTVSSATKTHIAILLALLALLKAGDYWFDRFELTNAQTGIVQGATYSVVQARIPALMLLILIAVFSAVLYLSVIRTGSFRAPLIASALWLVVSIVGGIIYPAIVQGLVVNPDQEAKESEYIERNVNATRLAYGLAEVESRDITFSDISASDAEGDLESLDNVRLLNPAAMESRFIFDEGREAGLTIDDLDVDRYVLDSTEQPDSEQVLVAALELDTDGLANTTWQSLHLINTHGCGLVTAPASSVQANRRPAYTVPDLDRPELYFSPSIGGYAISNTESVENPCDEQATYEGDLGVEMTSFARRASFALAFLEYNILASGAINDDSQMLWVRGVNDRLEKLAPFLSYDADPYPVEADGRVVWVVDAYTTTSRYPYAESVGDVELSSESGLSPNDNYVRNSVKAVVDAYTGEVTLFVIDEVDPIIRAWQQAFPDLFTSFDEMPDELREHLRYPEDLFRVQTDRYSKYRISPENFFRRDGAWSVAQAPGQFPGVSTATAAAPAAETAASSTFASESNTQRFTPYYTYFDTSPDDEEIDEEFVIFRPFVEFSTADQRTQLQAYMTASSDPDTYGQLISYVVNPAPGESLPDGPLRVASSAETTDEISFRISRDNTEGGGTKVRFGDLQAVPVADGLVYVRPYYVSVPTDSAQVPEATEFREVIVTYNQTSVLAPTIGQAMSELFRGFDADIGDRTGTVSSVDGDDTAAPDDEVVVLDENAEEVLVRIDTVLAEADTALESGDLGTYQEKVNEANDLIADAVDRLGLDTGTDDVTDPTGDPSTDDGSTDGESELEGDGPGEGDKLIVEDEG